MLSIEEQRIKNALYHRINKLFDSDAWANNANVIGFVPDYITELMTEAAFNVLLTVRDTNDYRDKK